MQLNYDTTLHLSVYDIEKILKQYLEAELGLIMDSIQFDVVTETCGYGTFEHECHNLKGATLKVNKSDASPKCKIGG